MNASSHTRVKSRSLQALAISFALGGVWDSFAAFQYLFRIGTGRPIDLPPIDPFYAIFLGSFFLCFAWLQILASLNIRRYAFCVGCLIFGRLFYIATLGSFLAFAPGFPTTFWFTGLIDGLLVLLSLIFARKAGLGFRDLFLPALLPPSGAGNLKALSKKPGAFSHPDPEWQPIAIKIPRQ